MPFYRTYRFVLIIAVILLFASCSNKAPVKITEGLLDLRGTALSEEFCYSLDGKWEFYWMQLLYPEDFAGHDIQPTEYFKLPAMWHLDKSLHYHGYATYKLKILLPVPKDNLMLKLGEVVSSYRLFVNGEFLAANGHVDNNPAKAEPGYYPVIISLPEKTDNIEIILQTANFHHANGGVYGEIIFGTEQAVIKNKFLKASFHILLFGSLLIMSLYHFGIFVLRKEDLSVLYFAIFSAIISFRILFTGQKVILNFFPELDWSLVFKLDHISFYLSPLFFVLFLKQFFYKKLYFKVANIFIITGLILSLTVLLTPVKTFSHLIIIYQIAIIALAIYILYIFFSLPNRDKKEVIILLVGGSIVFIALINDIFLSRGIFKTTELFPAGIFLFVLFQSFLISIRYSRIHKKNVDLALKIDYNRRNLEKIVKERTHQLSLRNKEINEQWKKLKDTNDKLEKQKKDLQLQREEMEKVCNLLEIEKQKSDKLLFNLLPGHIAEELKTSGVAKTKNYSNVSVMFADFADFSKISQNLDPIELVEELHYCFSSFDDILQKYHIDKIKTIGDAYMCAGGLTNKPGNWTVATVLVALEIKHFMEKYQESRKKNNKPFFKARIGIHSGPVISGVVGKSKFAFDIWGHTVNTASQMESACETGMVNISYDVFTQIKKFFNCESRGKISVKHKEGLEMFYVNRIKKEYSIDKQGTFPNELIIKNCKLNL